MWTRWVTAGTLAAALAYARRAVDDSVDAKAKSIVDKMSTEQVIGQMTQVDINNVIHADNGTLNEAAVRVFAKQFVGSYFNTWYSAARGAKYGWTAEEFRDIVKRVQDISMEENGGHPIIFGLDSVHGANYVEGAALFPQQINMGASFNPELVKKAAHITGRDTEAAGIPWIFGPILEVSYNPAWARTYETFGEDPYLVTVMGESVVRGLQSNNQTAACVKHFIGYSLLTTGKDRDNVNIGDYELMNHYMPQFKAAIEAGALTVMENYVSINGEPVVSSSRILNDLLRTDLGFDGLLVTDYNEINNLKEFHHVVKTQEEAVALSLTRTSIDMSMVPNDALFIGHAQKLLQARPDVESRLRESAVRVIKTKLTLGLYDNPVPGEQYVSMVGSKEDFEESLEMARESIVLLKNQGNVLPLPKTASVFLTGHSADNIGHQCGGWSKQWQGYSGNVMFPNGVSVRQGFAGVVGNDSFTYFNGLAADGKISDADMAEAVKHAGEHEYTVAVIGEATYTEKPGDIDNMALPEGQVKFIEALSATKTKLIVVLFGGRPRLLGSIPSNAEAVINGMLACEQAGQAMAEIIYGDVNPSGRMPITYPKDPNNIAMPYLHRVTTRCAYDNCPMEWNFGAGMSYSEFKYSPVTLDTNRLTSSSGTVTATVTVSNAGTRAGKETVMLFLIQPYRLISVPELKLLKKFKKIELKAGESMDVSFTLTTEDMSVFDPQIGKGLKRVLENSDYVVAIKPDTWCDVYNNITNPLCGQFSVAIGDASYSTPVAAPAAAPAPEAAPEVAVTAAAPAPATAPALAAAHAPAAAPALAAARAFEAPFGTTLAPEAPFGTSTLR